MARGHPALGCVSFVHHVCPQILALLGHNGAGKTTTLNVITGLFKASAGTVEVFGVDVNKDVQALQRVMGVCPQVCCGACCRCRGSGRHRVHGVNAARPLVRSLVRDATPAHVCPHQGPCPIRLQECQHSSSRFCCLLSQGVGSAQEVEAEARRLLKEVGLDHVPDAPVSTFSGGMKRRCSIAIACIGDVKVLLLDEPVRLALSVCVCCLVCHCGAHTHAPCGFMRRCLTDDWSRSSQQARWCGSCAVPSTSRRQLTLLHCGSACVTAWRLIQRLKKGRAIILTTHQVCAVWHGCIQQQALPLTIAVVCGTDGGG